MKWSNIKTTIFKEIRGVIRDKKSLHKLILFPLLIPLIILLFGSLFDTVSESSYTVGVNYELTEIEKDITKEMTNLKFEKYNDKKELEEAYNNKEISGYIVKEDYFYTIYVDETQNSGEIILALSQSYLDAYNEELGNEKLMNNKINPDDIYNNIAINIESLSSKESNYMTNMVFSLVIAYLIMIVVMACVVVVIDATSGEKERGTLETILTFPIKSGELVMGKYLATAIVGFALGLVAYLLSIPTILIGKKLFISYEEIVFSTNIQSIGLVVFVIFLAALLSSGICMALAGKARTYKEAQSSLQFITILPMLPYFLGMMEMNSSIFNFIPIANCGSLLNDIVVNSINYQSLLIIIITTIVYTAIILVYISKQYKQEETLFS